MAESGERPSQNPLASTDATLQPALAVDEADLDGIVGFASPSSLQGRPVEPPSPPRAVTPSTPPASGAFDSPGQLFPARSTRNSDEPRDPQPPVGDNRLLWAYTVYALILFAVPTAGVSAVIGVLAVTGRAVRAEEPLKSHYIFQQRTLWTAAAAALIGGVLIAIGLGVFILFLLAVWMIFRGAWGVFHLKAGRRIDNPKSWLV